METSISFQQLCPIIPMVIGYFFAVIIGHILIDRLCNELWKYPLGEMSELSVQRNKGKFQPQILGIIERIIYVTAFITGNVSFVGLWIGLKVASQWKQWSDQSRAVFNIFLIGNAMSLFYSWVGFKMIGWSGQIKIKDLGLNANMTMVRHFFKNHEWWIVPSVLMMFTLFLFYWVKQCNKKAKRSTN